MFTRLSSIRAEESMITITAEMAAHVHAKHVGKDISRKLTGDTYILKKVLWPVGPILELGDGKTSTRTPAEAQ